jgi:anaerobic ribonucleoside-triphosphate reductase activating protein
MKIAELKLNDCVDGEGITVSMWMQGCPLKCKGCHNEHLWDFEGGYDEPELKGKIIKAISANGIKRNFSILGGEPLCEENIPTVLDIVKSVRTAYPDIKIYLWTGYTYEYLISLKNENILEIFSCLDIMIDGPYVQEECDLMLYLRGSRNQRVIDMRTTLQTNNLSLVDKK